MRTSPTTANVAAALLACDLHDPGKRRRADGAPSRHQYANLGDFLGDLREELGAHELLILQSVDHARTVIAPWTIVTKGNLIAQGDGPVAPLVTRILHSSGEWIETDTPCTVIHDPQDQGSALTYARRYAIFATLGITAVDAKQADAKARQDDDGQRVRDSRAGKGTPAGEAARKAAHDPGWDAERTKFCSALTAEGTSYDDVAAWLDAQGIGSPSTLGTDGRRAVYADVRRSGPRRVELDEWLGRRDADGGAA